MCYVFGQVFGQEGNASCFAVITPENARKAMSGTGKERLQKVFVKNKTNTFAFP